MKTWCFGGWACTSSLSAVPVVLLFTACTPQTAQQFDQSCFRDSVIVGASDPTPPSAWLSFADPATNKSVMLKAGDPDMHIKVKPNSVLFVVAYAEDPQGVQEVTVVSGKLSGACPTATGDSMISGTEHLTFPDPFSPYAIAQSPFRWASSAGKGQSARTGACYPHAADTKVPPCVDRVLYAQARNFGGIATKMPVLTVSVTP